MHSYLLTHTKLERSFEKIREITGLSSDIDISHHPDIFILYPEVNEKTTSKAASVKIEMIRDLQTKLTQVPIRLPFQIGIIDQAEKVTLTAQQSLLKLLEEPKENTFFFLITEGSHYTFLPTILSRCQIISENLTDNTVDLENIKQKLLELNQLTFTKRMKFFESYSTSDSIIPWLREALACLNHQLHSEINNQTIILITNLQTALNDVQSNVNVKLVVDQLAINWNEHKLDEDK